MNDPILENDPLLIILRSEPPAPAATVPPRDMAERVDTTLPERPVSGRPPVLEG
ncbi:hypothetical protein [Paraburkholderia caballeronis]|uniref:hypothetical protein n=1 Tax=Paraburkholderia caballeronis TaxID=416943 RepID=UPI0010DC3359|nr:hypothetical protein [Paraburkholderia caballeronis]TDV16290.1 hypothetical protein C7406_108151 [Paraburkholderia caballeronis]TDV20640.1 hypothetical protein C7408_101151 [Paraburkholderia caballeronis]TDV33108.1 hypothetical protein C7404_101247 [Paraburkholderia caballeronis]